MAYNTYPAQDGLSDRFHWGQAIPFIGMHLAAFGVFWSGFTAEAVAICIGLYALRVFGITAGYHRYFSHRSYKTSRVFQFILALLGTLAFQSGVLWWSAKHREHHRDSDMPEDSHSPRQYGFMDSHVGWVYRPARREAEYELVQDWQKYPELVFLDNHRYMPGIILALLCYLAAGWPGLFVGFFLSTVLVYHATFMVNSLAHVLGKQRYLTGDDSRNNWFIALVTFGEGWHNNHHFYPGSSRQGFYWWEFDLTYYILKTLSFFGIVWDLQQPPQSVLAQEKQPPSKVIDKCAQHIAASFSVETIAERARSRWAQSHALDDLRLLAKEKLADAEAYLASIELPEFPSYEEVKQRAQKMFACTPSLDTAVERARENLRKSVFAHLLQDDLEPASATSRVTT